MHLESIEVNGAKLPLYATLEDQAAPPVDSFAYNHGTYILGLLDSAIPAPADELADFPTAPPRNVGVFFFVRENLRLPQFDSTWITTPPVAEKEKRVASNPEKQQPAPAPAPAPAAPATTATQAPAEPAQDKTQQAYEISAPSPVARDSPPANPTAAAPPEKPAALPVVEGVAIPAELSKSVDAKKNKVGDKVEAKTTAASRLPGGIVLARDTRIEGHISNLKAKSKDSAGAMVEITFDRALTADGRELPLHATLRAIGRPLTKAPAAMDDSMVSPGPGIPAAGSASGVPPPRGSPGPPPSEPPQVSNPDSGAAMPGEHDPNALSADSRGVVGLKGLALSTSADASVISSAKGNVHLDKGTQLILLTQ